ncbi:MAG: FAD-dependent oxidoreductase [Bifidobacteriaceae bacterium]|jgi:hypothetical protein|nr:FAD-dependent oxidoreductase [Bifidobacteriaceae bacterium]
MAKKRGTPRPEGENTEVSRRVFLGGAAAVGGTAALAGISACSPSSNEEEVGGGTSPSGSAPGADTVLTADSLDLKWSFEIPVDPVPDDQIAETISADIIVVGAGLSALCTAVSAQEQGADVRVFASSTKPVGRGGSNTGIGTKYQKEVGIEIDKDSPECDRLFKIQNICGGYLQNQKLWTKWRNNSAESMDWMIDIMAAKGLTPLMERGYYDPDGVLDAPQTSHNFYNADGEGGELFGAPMMAQAYADTFAERGGTIDFNTRAIYLIRGGEPNGQSGRVEAVVAQREDGSYVKYVANRAIVLATGDFSVNRDMMARYAPWTYENYKDIITWDREEKPDWDAGLNYTGLYPGDGHKMGLWIGAAWQRNPVTPIINCGVPSVDFLQGNGWLINLDETGHRFQRETTNFGYGGLALLNLTNKFAFTVWDSALAYTKTEWAGFMGVLTPDEQIEAWKAAADAPPESSSMGAPLADPKKIRFSADTIDDLLQQLKEVHPNVDIEAAKESIAKYSQYAKQGNDEEFHVKASVLYPIETPPFFAACTSFANGSSTFLTVCGGLRTNENMQVCTEDDSPIEGLYNTGIMTGDFYAMQYNFVFPGQNLGGLHCTLSYLLGRDLAKL